MLPCHRWAVSIQVSDLACLLLLGPSSIFLGKEFELGLELDSAEVRGILLYNNQEWGRFASRYIRCHVRPNYFSRSLFQSDVRFLWIILLSACIPQSHLSKCLVSDVPYAWFNQRNSSLNFQFYPEQRGRFGLPGRSIC